jgi:hypothetical protein
MIKMLLLLDMRHAACTWQKHWAEIWAETLFQSSQETPDTPAYPDRADAISYGLVEFCNRSSKCSSIYRRQRFLSCSYSSAIREPAFQASPGVRNRRFERRATRSSSSSYISQVYGLVPWSISVTRRRKREVSLKIGVARAAGWVISGSVTPSQDEASDKSHNAPLARASP